MSHLSTTNARAPIGTVVGAQSRMDIEGQSSSSGRRGAGGGGRGGGGRGRKGGRAGGGPVGSDYQSGSRYTPLSTSSRRPRASNDARQDRDSAPRDHHQSPAAKSSAPSGAGDAGSHVRTIKEWLATRVRGPGILDLHSMVTDPLLTGPGMRMPGHRDAKPLHGEVFWKCIAEQDPHTHTLRLSANNLRDLRTLAGLPKWLPHIRALDLSDNTDLNKLGMLDVLSTLSCLSSAKENGVKMGLYNLRELKLTGTKMRRDAEAENRMTSYLRDILARFPNLTMLDEELVPRIAFPVGVDYPIKAIPASEFQQIKARPFVWPFVVKGNLVETPALETFATTFLAKFFAEFDSDRTALLPVYAQHATLSHNMSSIAPRRRTKETSVVASRASFDTWGDQNRNLIRIGKNRRTQTLIVSDAQSLREWLVKGIPATKHPLDDPTRWMYDVLPLDAVAGVGRIMLTIHGEFYESGKQTSRAFSRNMILSEAQPGTPAAGAGWPGVILSDTLSVRPLCDIVNFSKSLAVAGAQIVPRHAAPAPPGVPADIAAHTELSPDQMLVVTQVQASTNLVTHTAIECAKTGGFNVELALSKFQELQGQIPPELFRQG
ncbi:nuclear mRNA export, poly(A)+RNA binding protein [Naganishia albida]|nr:nuclear mRNA export, poly(A)+RNA binding protein [Naganishia albida]